MNRIYTIFLVLIPLISYAQGLYVLLIDKGAYQKNSALNSCHNTKL